MRPINPRLRYAPTLVASNEEAPANPKPHACKRVSEYRALGVSHLAESAKSRFARPSGGHHRRSKVESAAYGAWRRHGRAVGATAPASRRRQCVARGLFDWQTRCAPEQRAPVGARGLREFG